MERLTQFIACTSEEYGLLFSEIRDLPNWEITPHRSDSCHLTFPACEAYRLFYIGFRVGLQS